MGFEAACALSSILLLVAVIRACAYFQRDKGRVSQLTISVIFLVSCASLLGVVLSKAYGMSNALLFVTQANSERNSWRYLPRAPRLDFRRIRNL